MNGLYLVNATDGSQDIRMDAPAKMTKHYAGRLIRKRF